MTPPTKSVWARLQDAGAIDVLTGIAFDHSLPASVVIGRSRLAPIVRARRALIKRLDVLGWSAASIGRALGLNHTSVLYALGRTKQRRTGS